MIDRSDIDRRQRDAGGVWKLDAAGGDATYVLVDRRKLEDRRHLCSPTCICAQDADREATHSEGSIP